MEGPVFILESEQILWPNP